MSEIEFIYEQRCRLLRRQYGWHPETLDRMPLDRLNNIVEETKEDYTDKDGKFMEKGFI